DGRARPAGHAEVLRGLDAGGWRLAPARGHLEHGHSLSTSNTKKEFNMSTITKLSMTIAALALSAGTVPTLAQPAEPVTNIVLVHGAFADGSSWAKVIAILQAKGYNVTGVQNPCNRAR